MSPEPPDRSLSRAILIGVSDYRDPRLPMIPAARNSLAGLQRMLTDPRLGGWPPARVTSLVNPNDVGQVATEVRELAGDTADALLLYYVGHGLLDPDGNLCLTLPGTLMAAAEFTGIRFAWIAEAIRASPATVKTVVLDCCFSGAATDILGSDDTIANTTSIEGTYTLAATERTIAAKVPRLLEQDSAPTSFTGELLDLVSEGVPGGPPHLSTGDLFPLLRQRLHEKGLPLPTRRATNTADLFVVAANVAAGRAADGHDDPPRVQAPTLVAARQPWHAQRAPGPLRSAVAENKLGFIAALLAVAVAVSALLYTAATTNEDGGQGGSQVSTTDNLDR